MLVCAVIAITALSNPRECYSFIDCTCASFPRRMVCGPLSGSGLDPVSHSCGPYSLWMHPVMTMESTVRTASSSTVDGLPMHSSQESDWLEKAAGSFVKPNLSSCISMERHERIVSELELEMKSSLSHLMEMYQTKLQEKDKLLEEAELKLHAQSIPLKRHEQLLTEMEIVAKIALIEQANVYRTKVKKLQSELNSHLPLAAASSGGAR